MSQVTYKVVEHDGGWAYTFDGVFSETYATHDDARRAAEIAAAEQGVGGETAGIVYFTRHFRLLPGAQEPQRTRAGGTGDLGFLKFGLFPADNGCFSITLCTPEPEFELRKAIVRPEVFDAICARLPGLAPWVDPTVAEAVSHVFGMGELQSRWREIAGEGVPPLLGYFPVGDALVRTNPLYGRGCSFAAVSAYLLRDVLVSTEDAGTRVTEYQERVTAELRPYYLNMRDQDRSAIRRAKQNLTPGYRPSIKSRVIKSFLEDGVNIAIRSDADLLREALRGFHMLEHPSAWLKRPDNLAKVLRYWFTRKELKADAYPPRLGPDRAEMFQLLGLPAEADMIPKAAR